MDVRMALLAALLGCCTLAAPGPSEGGPLRDPWVPPDYAKSLHLQQPAPTQGIELKMQIERKLRESFERADVEHRGSISRDEAKRAGLGLVANNFERIDTGGTGRITFDDLKRYLRSQGADL